MKKLIIMSLIFALLIIVACKLCTLTQSDYQDGILGFGFSFSFLGLLELFIIKASKVDKNRLQMLKKRLELEERIGGLSAEQKIREEIRLLEEGQLSGVIQRSLTTKLIEIYSSMPAERAEKIGTEPDLRILRQQIKLREKTIPFFSKVFIASGLILLLIYSIRH
jgi:hypothetical protein